MKVKICGITSPGDASMVAAAGADLVGLNFYEGSPRVVTPERAAEITARLPPEVEAVGLFVNASAREIRETCRAAAIGTVQLHGDEPPELLAELTEFRIIRAHRCDERGLEPLGRYLDDARQAGRTPDVILVDAHQRGLYGGTGTSAPWDVVAREYVKEHCPPLVLAGGLTPQNVGEAVCRVRPWGVDTASGVESTPGRKDPDLVHAFVDAARSAGKDG